MLNPRLKIAGIIVAALALAYFLLLYVFTDRDASLSLERGALQKEPLRFSSNFLWGSSTSAYQIEGGSTNNNWTVFEDERDEQGHPRIERGQKCGSAADDWRRYKEDIALMKDIHLNAYRFSVEWSKIEPEEGVFSDSVLDHYAQVVSELRASGIEPMITLHHFTNPVWFENRGGFLREDSPEILARFADTVVRRLAPQVRFWATINEPAVYAFSGYYLGEFPPAQRDPQAAVTVLANLLRSHARLYEVIKRIRPDAQVGLPINLFIFDPPNPWNLLDVLVAHYLNDGVYTSVMEFLKSGVFDFSVPGFPAAHFDTGNADLFDFVGLNYYSRLKYRLHPFGRERFVRIQDAPKESLTDMEWEIYPEGLYRALKMISIHTSKPIYITENGIADDSDTKRAQFIEDHILVANHAIGDGMNVQGYFYWSLIDNWEWTFGFGRRFGLYAVDFSTQKRTLREGSRRLPEMIQRAEESAAHTTSRNNAP